MEPSESSEEPANTQATSEKKKSGCGEGCKYGLIAAGIIVVLLLLVGGIGAMLGVNSSSSSQPTDQAASAITTTENQFTTKPTTVITTTQNQYTARPTTAITTTQSSQSFTQADSEYVAYVLASLNLLSPITTEIGDSATAMDINGVGRGGAKLRNTAIAANLFIEPLTVSSSLKVSKENYVLAMKSYAVAGNSYALAADAYNTGDISKATTLLESGNEDMSSGTYYLGLAKDSVPNT